MAAYRVLSSYYTDLLDMINIPYGKSQNFETAWNSLDKLTVVKLMANTMVKLDRLQETDRMYWRSNRTSFIFYIVIMAIVMVIIASMFGWFGFMRYIEYTKQRDASDPYPCAWGDLMKSLFFYILMYIIVFAVLYLLILNFDFVVKQSNAQLQKNKDDFNMFKGFLISIPNGQLLDQALLYIGYLYKGNIGYANQVLTDIKAEITLVNNQQQNGQTSSLDLTALNTYSSFLSSITTSNINQSATSPQLLSDIHDCLQSFFDNGNGYYNLKVNIVSVNNVYTLREVRRLTNFYYYLTLKKSSDNDPQIQTANDHLLINQVIIQPIITLGLESILSSESNEVNLINNIVTTLTPYQIDLSKYSDYFITELEIALALTTSKTVTSSVIQAEGNSFANSLNSSQNNVSYQEQGKHILNQLIQNAHVNTPNNTGVCNGKSSDPNLVTIESSPTQSSFMTNLYNRITTEVYIKQQTSLRSISGTNKVDNKYYTPYGFLLNLNNIPYEDFKEGCDVQYLSQIIGSFYNRISNAKYNYSLDDINYQGHKAKVLFQQFMSMFMIILALAYAYFVFSWFNAWGKKRKVQKEELEKYEEKYEEGDESGQKGKKLKTQHGRESINMCIMFGIVSAGCFFIFTMVYSSYEKRKSIFEYNIEIIESNTSDFKDSINQLLAKMNEFDSVASKTPLDYIGNIPCIKDIDKFEVQTLLLNIIDKFEKCNYILETSKNKFPFPYSELMIDIFMIAVILGGVAYLSSNFKIGEKYAQIMEWKQLVFDLENGITAEAVKLDHVIREAVCHDNEMDNIAYTVKVIFFVFIFLFLLYYSVKLLESSNGFKTGIYNSAYFDENQCYGA